MCPELAELYAALKFCAYMVGFAVLLAASAYLYKR